MKKKFDVTKFPIGQDGKQLLTEDGHPAMFRNACIVAITSEMDADGVRLHSKKKFDHYDIYVRLKNSDRFIELDDEDIATLTTAALALPIVVAGQIRDWLAAPEPDA